MEPVISPDFSRDVEKVEWFAKVIREQNQVEWFQVLWLGVMFLSADENIRNKSVEKGCLSFIEPLEKDSLCLRQIGSPVQNKSICEPLQG